MSVLAGLKLVAAKPQLVMDPVQLRRNKLVSKLDEQIALAKAVQEGGNYTPMRAKRVKDAAGNVSVVQVPKRVKAWYWAVEGGKVCVAVRYGGKQLELGKGKTAVETQPEQLAATLGKLREAAAAGELDAQVEVASAGVRRGFKR
jgi:hypothetical protein